MHSETEKLLQDRHIWKIISPLNVKVFLLIFFLFSTIPNISNASEQKLKVVASITPLADFVKQVGGDKVDVMLLLPPGASPHTYAPTPKTIQAISKARIFIKIGAGLEFWADKLINAANSRIIIVECSKGIELIKNNNQGQGVDPHIWLDPLISVQIIKKIEIALSRADPLNSSIYKRNASLYTKKLIDLNREIAEQVKTFRTKEYITFHPAWSYFSRRYGLRVVGVIKRGHGKEPTPKHLTKILKELKRMDNRIVFADSQFSPKVAEAIAQEAGGKVLILDPVGGQKNRETYINMMRYNLSIIKRAMK